MSTATAFKYHRPFPFCLGPRPSLRGRDFVDVPLTDAMALWWNLENLEFVTTGTSGTASINWTTTIGAVESFPFTPTPSLPVKDGIYYNGTAPAKNPIQRVCLGSGGAATAALTLSIGVAVFPTLRSVRVNFVIFASPTPGNAIVDYLFEFRETQLSGFSEIMVCSPALGAIENTGTAPSSGAFSILGIDFDWVGGGSTGTAWNSDVASISCASSAFTY